MSHVTLSDLAQLSAKLQKNILHVQYSALLHKIFKQTLVS